MYTNVEDLLNSHGIEYEKKGYKIWCLCPNPNHNDAHIGSFSYDLKKNLGYCFACGCGVNLISFNRMLGEKVEKDYLYNVTWLKQLGSKKKVTDYEMPIVYGDLYDPFYNKRVLDFLHGIGFSDDFIIDKKIGYCKYCEMISENLIDGSERPTVMKNRICIPIFKDGALVNYECRTFDKAERKVKYVKGCSSNLLYNYENINLNEDVVLTESIKNLGKGWNVTKNIISSFGNQITDLKLEFLNKIPSLIAFLDYDDGGLTMLNRLIEGYEGKLRVTFCPKKYYDSEGNQKGKDMNDCSLDEIRYYLQNTMSANKAKDKLTNSDKWSSYWK